MNQDQSDELKSLEETQKLLDDNAAKYAGIPALVAAKGVLDGHITQLKMKRAIQDADQTGLAEGKKNLRETVTDDILVVAGALVALGAINTDQQMINQFNFTKSELDKKRIGDFLDDADVTVVAANNNIADLTAQCGLTALQVTDLTNHNATLTLANTTPDQAINTKKVATATIKEIFPATRTLKDNIITPLMRTNFSVSDQEFYLSYLASLQIVNTGHHFEDVHGFIFDPTTNVHVGHVTIKVLDRNNNNAEVMTIKSGEKGHYQIKQLAQGNYVFHLFHPNFQIKEESVNKGDGINIKKNFAMDPL